MGKYRKPLIVLAILLAAFMIFSFIYRAIFSMEEATSFEVNSPELETKVFIATQGSTFKDELVSQVIDSLKGHSIYVAVRDITVLTTINPDNWQAILVIHTWEYSSPPEAVRQFASSIQNQNQVVFFTTTSGIRDYSMEGVDAISGASNWDHMNQYVNQIMEKLKLLLPNISIDESHIVH